MHSDDTVNGQPRNVERESSSAIVRWGVLQVCVVSALTTMGLSAVRPAAGEVIDRVVAVVNGSVITLSDVEGARRFGFIAAEPGDLRTAVERVIDRRLALVEVERYTPPEPPEATITEAIAVARARFPSDVAFTAALAETGLTTEHLRRYVRDDLRLRTYEQQRFGFAMQPSEEETLAFFRSNQERFRRGGTLPPFEEVRAEVRAALVADRRAASIRDWMDGLRRRAEITILPM